MQHNCPSKRLLYGVGAVASALLALASAQHRMPIGPLEMLGALTGAWCVWLTVDENLWTWPVGMASSLLFAVLFAHQRLFGAAGMQIAYVAFSAIGWYCWRRGGARHERLCISRVPTSSALLLGGLWLALLPLLTFPLRHWHDAAPLPDALALSLSLVAQYLVTKKFVEHWAVSMAADAVYVALYLSHGLFLTGSLYLMHLGSCACGLWQWRRSLEAPESAPEVAAEGLRLSVRLRGHGA